MLKVEIDVAGAREIAKRSRGTPRVANRLLRRVRDYAQVRANGVITEDVARAALAWRHLGLVQPRSGAGDLFDAPAPGGDAP